MFAAALRDAKTGARRYPRIALRFIRGYFRSFPPGMGHLLLLAGIDWNHNRQQELFVPLPWRIYAGYRRFAALADLARGVLKDNVGQNRGVGFVRQVRAEADAGIERPVDVQMDGRPELMHRLAFRADE